MSFCNSWEAPHPRDGPWAWLVCFAATMMNGLLFGYLLSFGVFLPVLSEQFQASRGTTAWIGSLQIGISFLCGPVAIKIIEHFGERTVAACSGISGATFLIISSYVENIYILYFSHGILLGFCGCFLINVFMIITRKYFRKNLAVAVGITTSGSSIGVLSIGPTLQALIDALGWRGTFRVATGAMFLISLLGVTFDPNVEDDDDQHKKLAIHDKDMTQSKSYSEFIDCSAWKSPKYAIGTISIFLTFLGLYVPMIHLVQFAKDNNIPGSKASLLFIYIGICSTFIRIAIGKVIDKRWLSPLQALQLSSFAVGITLILLTQAEQYFHFIIFSIFFGFGNGAFITTQCVFFLTCFSDLKKSSVSVSMGFMTSSIALFTGAPSAGFVADFFQSYVPAFYIFGGIAVLAGCLPFCLRSERKAFQPKDATETRLKLIGSRLANIDSTLNIEAV